MNPTRPTTPTKTIGKNKFYKIDTADQILHSRYMVAEIQELYIRAGISESFLKEISNLLISRAQQQGDHRTDMFAIGQNLLQRIGMVAEKKMYEELACVYFLMDDEPNEYLPEWQEKKKALWGKHPKERDFFIMEAFKLTNASLDTSVTDILAVFKAVEERIEQLPPLPI